MSVLGLYSLFVTLLVTFLNCVTAEPEIVTADDGTKFLIEMESKYNWFEALHECGRRNYQLVEVHDGDKHNTLLKTLNTFLGKSTNLWLGANDQFSGDRDLKRPFYWASSGKRMTFSHWCKDNPNNDDGEEHCVHTWEDVENFGWNDNTCTSKMGFVCEERPKNC
ncbi:lectin subunit alpha [Stomoxys calcitrans]|uniref:lectin subunit alpha n=1 Tax=Stomoxys calcitrans TaxID=35570 RepID=UPI0027E2D72B|nr:lectin subunit alpha [Stomoxys calcitrans]